MLFYKKINVKMAFILIFIPHCAFADVRSGFEFGSCLTNYELIFIWLLLIIIALAAYIEILKVKKVRNGENNDQDRIN